MDVVTVLTIVQTVTALATLALTLINSEGSNNSENATKKDTEEVFTELKSWLSTFQAVLGDKQREETGRSRVTQDLVNQIRDCTFDIEDAFDEFLFAVPHHFLTTKIGRTAHKIIHSRTYRNALEKLSSCRDTIKGKIMSQKELNHLRKYGGPLQEDSSGTSSSSQDTLTHYIVEEDEFVDLKGRRERLVNQLISTNVAERATILVVGPGGSGKTFLVKNVYRDKQLREKFDCHAWIHVSPSCKVEIILLDMFKQFCPEKIDQISSGQGVDIHEKLHRYLEDKKYLVVLDNVWNKQGYTPFANALPNHSKGSRIIVTARNNNVADAYMSNHIHSLDGLNQKEAWNLFCRKAFRDRKGDCPKELKSSSEKIIERCEGLPLVIAAAGSLLSKKQKIQSEWDEFHKRFDYEIGPESCLPVIERILQPSFEDLPDNLRSCFLYLSLFPKGYPIKRGRLIRLWIAEGFLEGTQVQTLEKVAETYMNILIERNLVQVSEREIDGRVRSCKVSNLFHKHLLSMSRKASFLTLPQPNSNLGSSEKVRRLSINDITTNLTHTGNSRELRTFFMFGQPDASTSSSSRHSLREKIRRRISSDSLENISENFRLLKVLDMQDTPLKDFPKDIGRLVLLRCLNLSNTQVEKVPRYIKKLAYLETLNLKHTLVTNLPKGIYKLHKLRHLLVSHYDGKEERGVEISGRITSLSSLQELSLVMVNNEPTIENMGNLKELKKLRLVCLQNEFGKKLCESIQKMKTLTTLDVRAKTGEEFTGLNYDMEEPPQIQRLYFKGSLPCLPGWIPKLQSLVKLCLKGSGLNPNVKPVEAFEDLQSLMELEMVDYYTGKKLVFKAGKFNNLKKLHIEEFPDLSELVVENYAMTKLEKLIIRRCNKLKSVPDLGAADCKPLVEFLDYGMNVEFSCDLQRGKKNNENFDVQEEVPLLLDCDSDAESTD